MREEAKAPAYSASATNEQTTGVGRDRVVEGRVVVEVAEKVRAAGDTPGRRAGEVGGVREATENHSGRSVYFSSVGVGGGVAEETVETGHGFGGGLRLLGRKGNSDIINILTVSNDKA